MTGADGFDYQSGRNEDSGSYGTAAACAPDGFFLTSLVGWGKHHHIGARHAQFVDDNVNLGRESTPDSLLAQEILYTEREVKRGVSAGKIGRRHFGEDSFHDLITTVEPLAFDFGIVEVAGCPTRGAGLEWAGFCQTRRHATIIRVQVPDMRGKSNLGLCSVTVRGIPADY